MFDEHPSHNFDPNTGRKLSTLPLTRAFQKATGRIGVNVLLATLPSEEDTPLKRRARNIAGHLLSAININTNLDDPAILPGVSEGGSQLSGTEPYSQSRRRPGYRYDSCSFSCSGATNC